jgi:polyphosphate kinase 2 (PPK2 family)
MNHFPAAGEVVIFLTGAGITVPAANTSLGFCSREQHRRFLDLCPVFERYVVDAGIILIKYWLEVGNEEQERRFEARIEDPLRQWKLSPIDLPSREKWYEYSHARDLMLESTDTTHAPWHLVRSDDKKWARLNCITHLLTQIPHKKLPQGKAKLSKRSNKHKLDDQATLKGRTFIPEKYKSEGGLSEVQPLKRGRQRCVSPSAPITRDFN